MKRKNKLLAAFGLLFLVVIFFGAISLFYLRLISNSNTVILKDNYDSLKFIGEMRSILNENNLPLPPSAIEKFNTELVKEQNNITESGEKEAVENLKQSFDILRNSTLSIDQQTKANKEVLRYLGQIEKLNLNAVESKSDKAKQTSEDATIYIGAAAAVTFLVLFSFVFNLAAFFEEPLRRLTEGIKEITLKNYNTRLTFDRKDEFGEVSESFNAMAESLNKWDKKNSIELIIEKLRTETLINQIQDPLIVTNEFDEIIFINFSAANIFDLDSKKATGYHISKLSGHIMGDKQDVIVKIKDSNYQLKIHEIVIPLKDLSQLGADISIITSGKPIGKVHFFRKQV